MEERKVYLFVETPFSFKKPKGMLLLPMAFSLIVNVVIIAFFWLKMPDYAALVTIAMVCAFALSVICIAVFRLSFVTVEDGCLVCRYCGLFPMRIPISADLKAETNAKQLQIRLDETVFLSIPDSDAARMLIRTAHIPMEA